MYSDNGKRALSLRLSVEEMTEIERMQKVLSEKINQRAGATTIKVSQKMLVMEALEALRAKWKEAERKRG